MRAAICSRSARCSTRWRRARCRFVAIVRQRSSRRFWMPHRCRRAAQSRCAGGVGAHHQQGAGEGSKSPLPERRGFALRPDAAEAGPGLGAGVGRSRIRYCGVRQHGLSGCRFPRRSPARSRKLLVLRCGCGRDRCGDSHGGVLAARRSGRQRRSTRSRCCPS